MPVEAFPNTPNWEERLESDQHLDGLNTARRFRGTPSASSLLFLAKTYPARMSFRTGLLPDCTPVWDPGDRAAA
jgi:hypothetical protein